MRRINQIGSLVFLAVALYVVKEAMGLDYMSSLGPGPGFFPLWLGIAMTGLSGAWFVQTTVKPEEPMPEGYTPDRSGWTRVVSIVVALVAVGVLMETLGFQLSTFLFLFFLLLALGRQNLLFTLFLSGVGSFGTYYLFKVWLHVPLPTATIDLLKNLGL